MYTKQNILDKFRCFDIYAVADRSCKDDISEIVVVINEIVMFSFYAVNEDEYKLDYHFDKVYFEALAFTVANDGGAIYKLN